MWLGQNFQYSIENGVEEVVFVRDNLSGGFNSFFA
jgi:hypothetical protein